MSQSRFLRKNWRQRNPNVLGQNISPALTSQTKNFCSNAYRIDVHQHFSWSLFAFPIAQYLVHRFGWRSTIHKISRMKAEIFFPRSFGNDRLQKGSFAVSILLQFSVISFGGVQLVCCARNLGKDWEEKNEKSLILMRPVRKQSPRTKFFDAML